MEDAQSTTCVINFYKGLAMIGILTIHTSQSFALPDEVLKITKFGDLGCQIFFLISAFCLCLSQDKKEYTIIDFYKRRASRIYPSYWVAIVLSILLATASLVLSGKNKLNVSIDPLDILMNVLGLNGLCWLSACNQVVRGGWYIGTTIVLYIMFPFIWKTLKNKKYAIFLPHLLLICNFLFWYIMGESVRELELSYRDSNF